ncbi:MAG: hypothetical protein KGH53_02425 [Candidatus Micrarchaeota archaeon]|nr:hypothetical protein [Candidatus Micrarchaeota archaeon]
MAASRISAKATFVAEFTQEVSLMLRGGRSSESVVRLVDSTLKEIQGTPNKPLIEAIRKELSIQFPELPWTFKEPKQ